MIFQIVTARKNVYQVGKPPMSETRGATYHKTVTEISYTAGEMNFNLPQTFTVTLSDGKTIQVMDVAEVWRTPEGQVYDDARE